MMDIRERVEQTGSTYIPVAELGDIQEKVENGIIKTKVVDGVDCAVLKKHEGLEIAIAKALHTLHMSERREITGNIDDLIKAYEEKNFSFSDEQKDGIKMAVSERVSVLTGGPGTGKTSVILCAASIIKEAMKPIKGRDDIRIVFLAPNEKAAKRIKERTGYAAYSVYRYLIYAPRVPDYLFVDEASMLGEEMLYALLRCFLWDTSICFIGDKDQLPGVTFGSCLRDIISSGIIPVTGLEKNFRRENSSKFVQNIQIVRDGGQVPFMEAPDFHMEAPEEDVLKQIAKLYVDSVEKYGINNVAILSPCRNLGEVCSEKLNDYIQKIINPEGPFVVAKRKDGRLFRIRRGDLVMQTVDFRGLAIGEIGTVTSVSEDRRSINVSFMGTSCRYTRRMFDQLELAYALPVHKSQGSKYACIICPFLKEHANLNQNLIYTAFSRGEKECIVISEPHIIKEGCAIQETWGRKTGLAEEIRIKEYTVKYTVLLDSM